MRLNLESFFSKSVKFDAFHCINTHTVEEEKKQKEMAFDNNLS